MVAVAALSSSVAWAVVVASVATASVAAASVAAHLVVAAEAHDGNEK